MKFSLKKALIYGILLITIVSIGYILYTNNKSANKVPKRAKLVTIWEEFESVG